ncbi:MAG: oligosaccharide flippase family protein [Pseudonocardia sp.]
MSDQDAARDDRRGAVGYVVGAATPDPATARGGSGRESADRDARPEVAPLGGTLRRGAAISSVTLVLVQATSLVTTLLLARLLSPQEVGVYAAGTILTGFLVMFAEGGMKGALIQRPTDVEDAAATVFWATAGTGVLMSLAALAAAPLVGLLFRDPLAAEIAAVTSGMLLMQALTNVPDGLLQREFNFKRRLIVDPLRSLGFGVVAVALAAAGFGVWSLAIGNYVSMALWLIGTWALGRWRPGRGRPSYRLWRELARFAFPLLIQSVVWQIREAGQAAIVGRFLGTAALGQFRYGRRVGLLPAQAVVQVGSYVLFPAFSRLAGDPDRLKVAFLRSLRWLWISAAPVAGFIVALGEPSVVLLLGQRWAEAGVFLVGMAGYGAAIAVKAAAGEAIKGTGHSRLLNWASATQLVLGLGLVLLALPFGLFGVGLAISATEIALAALVLGLARRVVGFTLRELFQRLVPPLVAAVAAAAVVGVTDHALIRSVEHGTTLAGILMLAGETVVFAVLYLVVLRMLDRQAVTSMLGAARQRISRRARRAGP